jgi:hypothetical protein
MGSTCRAHDKDIAVIALNRTAFDYLQCEKEIVIVPDGGHLFE